LKIEKIPQLQFLVGFVALVAAMMFRSLGLVDVMRLLQNDHTVISSSRTSILRNVIDSVLDGNSRPSSEGSQ
jgi:hypothetical protein